MKKYYEHHKLERNCLLNLSNEGMSEVKQLKGATGFRHTATTVKTRARDNSNTYSELDLETLIHFRREKKKKLSALSKLLLDS